MSTPRASEDVDAKQASDPMTLIVSLYESEWIRALEGTHPPEPETLIDRMDESERPTLRERLSVIEKQYRARWSSQSGSVAETIMPTMPPQSAPPQGLEPTLPPKGPAPTDETMDLSAGDTRPDAGRGGHPRPAIDTAPQMTLDFDGTFRGGKAALDVKSPTGYEILGELGRGGMGVVYRARQTGLNRQVALKMILAGAHTAPEHLARFQAEAEAVAQLQHPHIVQVYDVGELDGLPFFSLELVDGHSLEEERDGKPMLPLRAAEVVETITRAMHYAHEHGIVHRDLKPGNVLLTREGVAKVSDFGLAKQLEADSSQTRTGTVMGTPSYMAPEQAKGEKNIGPLADVYSLGAVLYCLLTGRPPFLAATAVDTVVQLLNSEPVPPSKLQTKTPCDLETIALKCLQKEPVRRYASALELAEDLRRYRAGEPIQARPVGKWERFWRWCRRNPKIAVPTTAAALLALALIIGGPIAAMVIYQQKELAVDARNTAETNAEKAKQAELKAVDARNVAEENEEKAKNAEQDAVEAKMIAATQGRFALDTLNSLISDVQDELADRPRLQDFRRRLLGKAVGGLDLVAAKGIDVNRKDLLTAGACRRLGEIYLELGQNERALEQFQLCHAAVEQLADDGALPNPHHNVSFSYMKLGQAARNASGAAQAKEYFLKALEVRRDWLTTKPKDQGVAQNVAATLGDLGSVSMMLGQVDEAEKYYEESRQLRQQWVAAEPDNPDARRELAGADAAMGTVSKHKGRLEDAERFTRDAFEALWKLHQEQPENRKLPWNAAIFSMQLATIHLMEGKASDSMEEFNRAVALLQPLCDEDPDNARARRSLAEALYGLATAELRTGDERSAEHYRSALQMRRQLLEEDPGNAGEQIGLMLALGRCGEHEEAAELAGRLRESHKNNAHVLYFVGTGYALCAWAVNELPQTGTEQQGMEERAEQYAQAAINTLQSAIAQGYEVTSDMALDPDLDGVRNRPEFQDLLTPAKTGDSDTAEGE